MAEVEALVRHFKARARSIGKMHGGEPISPDAPGFRLIPDTWETRISEVGVEGAHVMYTLGYGPAQDKATAYVLNTFDLRPSEFTLDFRPEMDDALYERALKAHEAVSATQKAYWDAVTERQAVLAALIELGHTPVVIADLWGISRTRVSQMLPRGTSAPE